MAIPAPYLIAKVIGQEGVDDGELSSPTGIAVDKDGNIYVADTDNHSIQKFDKDGTFIGRWGGEAGSAEGSYYYPRGLTTNSDGQVYVADTGNNRVQRLDVDGNPMKTWGNSGLPGAGPI